MVETLSRHLLVAIMPYLLYQVGHFTFIFLSQLLQCSSFAVCAKLVELFQRGRHRYLSSMMLCALSRRSRCTTTCCCPRCCYRHGSRAVSRLAMYIATKVNNGKTRRRKQLLFRRKVGAMLGTRALLCCSYVRTVLAATDNNANHSGQCAVIGRSPAVACMGPAHSRVLRLS